MQDTLIRFITVLAWVFGIASSLLLILRILRHMCYTETQKTLNLLRGRVATFPKLVPFCIAAVCWAWILVV